MARTRTAYRCGECGAAFPQWSGRCGGCGEWNSLVAEVASRAPLATPVAAADIPLPLADVDAGEWVARSTGVVELDRVLGGGLVPGSVTLVAGEPGIGKSTLLLQALGALAASARCLLVCGEESKQQVRLRAERLGVLERDLWLHAETSLPAVLEVVGQLKPDFVVVDSIQTLYDPELESAPGSVGQVRDCAARLVRLAKETGVSVVLVGHVTKEGTIAGPRVLEHVVDTVLSFEGERHHALRMLRAVKHRFGSTSELGVFEMGEDGLWGVPDASALFLGDRGDSVPGSTVAPVIEGARPLLVEIQALVGDENPSVPSPRRSVQGVENNRLAMLLAVLQRRCGVRVAKKDVYVSTVGGVRVAEPGADAAIALSVASSAFGQPLSGDLVACGEVGLGGELRQAGQTARRLQEAARLGFRQAIVPKSAPEGPPGLTLHRCGTLLEAIRRAGLTVR